jgi:hypothetical protein
MPKDKIVEYSELGPSEKTVMTAAELRKPKPSSLLTSKRYSAKSFPKWKSVGLWCINWC